MDSPGSRMIARPCPICGGQSNGPLLRKKEHHLVRCASCRTVFATPLLADLIRGSYYTAQGHYYLGADKLQSDFSPVRYEREVRLFHRFCSSGDVLDVGCSTGGFLFQLRARFPGCYQQLRGIDVSLPAIDHARSLGLDVQSGEFVKASFGSQRFDAITFWAVLEHLVDPVAYLHRAAELLRPGGCCFVLVPNLRSLAVRVLGKRYRYFMDEHINWFDAHALKKFIAREPALRLHYLTSTHFNPLVILQDALRPREDVPGSERAALLKRTTNWKERASLWPLRLMYRWSESALAQFFLADNLVLVAQRG